MALERKKVKKQFKEREERIQTQLNEATHTVND